MCGIVGIASAYTNGFSSPEADAFDRMLFLDTFRGPDSTGVFGIDRHANVGILKEASMAPNFMSTKEYKEWRGKLISSGVFAVGHNRAATRGTIKDENAHPFYIEDNIVLVQNGTFYGDHRHLKNTEVDTEAIAHVIHEEGDVEKALNRINSAYALVWFNVKEKSLNLIRNEQRPLHVAYTASGAFLFASEAETLNYVIAKAGWKMKHEPYMMKEHSLLKLTLDKKGGYTSENIEISPEKTFPVVVAAPSAPVVRRVGHDVSDEIGKSWQRRHLPANDPNAINKQFYETFPGNSKEYDLTTEEHKQLHAEYLDLVKGKSRVVVETQDYLAANDSRECRAWHIVSTILNPNASILDKIVVHWCVANIDETEVYRYVANVSWYEVTLNGLVISKNGDSFLARAYGSGAVAVQGATHAPASN